MTPFVVRARPSVKFDRIAPAGFCILAAIHEATQRCELDLTITAGTDSHGPTDPHALGEGYDVSVLGLAPATIARLVSVLRSTLGSAFTVLYETPTTPRDATLATLATVNPAATGAHIHVQRKRGTVYPPEPGKAA